MMVSILYVLELFHNLLYGIIVAAVAELGGPGDVESGICFGSCQEYILFIFVAKVRKISDICKFIR